MRHPMQSNTGTRIPGGTRFHLILWKHAQVKKKHGMLITPGDSPLNKNSVPPLARPLTPPVRRRARPTYPLHLVGQRRGLARRKM
jgi:hypothetical protein